jgi:hypothetical protein
MKYLLNKWQTHFYFGKDYTVIERGWKQIEFGIMKFTSYPNEGCKHTKKNYNGFLLKFYMWFPIDF